MQNVLARTAPVLLLVTVFSIPISTSLKSIFLPLTLIAILLNHQYRQQLVLALKEWACILAIALVAWFFFTSLYSPAPWKIQWSILHRILKILCLPVLIAGFQHRKTRQAAIYCFLAATFVVFLVSLYRFYQWFGGAHIDPGKVFHNRIVTGFTMAIAAWIAASQAIVHKKTGRWILGLLAIAFSLQILFINTSRTGHITYVILGILFFFTLSNWRQQIASALILLLLTGTAFHFSPILSRTLQRTQNEIVSILKNNKTTSIGYRIQFQDYAQHLFLQKPIFGHGAGSFTWQFKNDNPILPWGPRLFDPHNQYWLMAVEGGIIGLGLLLAFFASLLWATMRLKPMQISISFFLVAFYLGNLGDSLLLYSATGYLFLIFASLAVAENIEERQTITESVTSQLQTVTNGAA